MTIEEIEKLVESRYPNKTPYTKEFIRKSIERYGDVYSYEKTSRVDNNLTKVIITCPIHGDFEIDPYYFIKSKYCKGCPECNPGRTSKRTKEDFVKALYKKFPEYIGWIDFSESTDYTNNNTIIDNIKCLKHNKYFSGKPSNLWSGKLGCSECRPKVPENINPESVLRKKNSNIARSIKLLNTYGINFRFPDQSTFEKVKDADITVICPVHGEYSIKYFNLIALLRKGSNPCLKCRDENFRKEESKKLYDKLNFIYQDYDFDFSWILDNYIIWDQRILVKCRKHCTESWERIGSLLQGYIPCDECRTASSIGEDNVKTWLICNNIKFHIHQSILDCRGRTDNSSVNIDFCIPSMNIWIECNGEQHYRYVKRFQETLEDYNNQLCRDQNVRRYCNDNGITLIEIPYTYYRKDKIDNIMNQIFLEGKSFSDLGLKIPEIKTYPNGLGN